MSVAEQSETPLARSRSQTHRRRGGKEEEIRTVGRIGRFSGSCGEFSIEFPGENSRNSPKNRPPNRGGEGHRRHEVTWSTTTERSGWPSLCGESATSPYLYSIKWYTCEMPSDHAIAVTIPPALQTVLAREAAAAAVTRAAVIRAALEVLAEGGPVADVIRSHIQPTGWGGRRPGAGRPAAGRHTPEGE